MNFVKGIFVMSDERKLSRKTLNYFIDVFNLQEEIPVGLLVDISDDGMMINFRQELAINQDYDLAVSLEDRMDSEKVPFKARSMWCKKIGEGGNYDVGFKLTEASAGAQKVFDELRQRILENRQESFSEKLKKKFM